MIDVAYIYNAYIVYDIVTLYKTLKPYIMG